MIAALSRISALLSLVACVACVRSAPPTADSGPQARPIDAAPSPTVDATSATPESCASLPRTRCMESTACELEFVADKRYRCRPARSPCEVGFAQAGFYGVGDTIPAGDEQQSRCRARVGCEFFDQRCYCHCRGYGAADVPDGDEASPCACECGGGAPQTCREIGASP